MGLLVAAVGIAVLYVSGVVMPVVPPGLVLLVAAVLVVALAAGPALLALPEVGPCGAQRKPSLDLLVTADVDRADVQLKTVLHGLAFCTRTNTSVGAPVGATYGAWGVVSAGFVECVGMTSSTMAPPSGRLAARA